MEIKGSDDLMEYDLVGIRRGNFIISKREMDIYFDRFEDLFIIFNKPVSGKRYKYPGSIFSVQWSDYSNSFRMYFTDIKEGFHQSTITQFIEEMIPFIMKFLDNDENRNKNSFFHICENEKILAIVKR